jgi:hypothetical protein
LTSVYMWLKHHSPPLHSTPQPPTPSPQLPSLVSVSPRNCGSRRTPSVIVCGTTCATQTASST